MGKTEQRAETRGDEGTRGLTGITMYGFFWTSLGTGSQVVSHLLVLAVLARLLTPADFGVVSAALVVISLTSVFSQLGVGPALVQRATLEPRHLETAFTLTLLFGIALTGLCWLLAQQISNFFHIEALTPVVRVMSLVFLLQGISTVAESLMQRDLQFRRLANIEVLTFTGGFGAVGVLLALLDFGLWALVGAHLAQTLLKTIVLLVIQPHPKRPLLERHAVRDLLVFGGGLTLVRIGNYLAGFDMVVVGRWLGAEALGIYGRANQLMVAPAMAFGQILDKVLFPAMAKIQKYPERLAKVFRRSVTLIALVILPVSAVLFFLAPELIYVLLGPDWNDAIVPFQIFAVGMLFRTSYKMSDSISRATGAVYRWAWRQGVYAALVITGAYIGQRWGVDGVALGVSCAIAINFLLMAQLSLWLVGMTWRSFWAAHLPAVALTIVVGTEVWALAHVLRDWDYPPIVVLVISAMAVMLTMLVLARYIPQLFLGQDGLWMVQTLAAYLPARINPFYSLRRSAYCSGDMQEIPACVEFFGLPGAGKSTLSKRVAEIMSRAGIAVDQPMYVLAHQAPRYKRIAIKSFYVLKGLCLHPDYTIRSAKAILRTKQNSIADLVLVLFNWLFVSSFIRHPRSREAVRLLDRGLFQALWSVGFSARQPESLANMFSELAPVLPLPDIVIVVEVEPPIAAQRMSTRVCHDSRVKQAPPHAASSLTRAQVTVAEVKAILRIIAAGRWAMVTLEVENKQPDDLDCNAQRIARTIRVSSNMV